MDSERSEESRRLNPQSGINRFRLALQLRLQLPQLGADGAAVPRATRRLLPEEEMPDQQPGGDGHDGEGDEGLDGGGHVILSQRTRKRHRGH